MKRLMISMMVAVMLLVPIYSVCYAEDYDDFVIDVFLNNENCPLEIINWNAWYRANDKITFGDAFVAEMTGSVPNVREAGFQYDLRMKHNGDKSLVAFQVNVVVFSAFEEYLDTFGIFQGAILKPDKDITRKNRVIFNGDSQFMTFFLWVDKVRDVDGNLYFADLTMVKSAIEDRMGIEIPTSYLTAGIIQEINQQTRFREVTYTKVRY